MEQPKPAPNPGTLSMLDVLDRTLARHLERITGNRDGIQGLPLGIVTVACIVLMSERAGDAGTSTRAENLDRAELQAGLSEMGLEDPERFESTLEGMIQKGYVELDARGRLVPCKPALSMARLLDHAFPGMPGLNLVAYFVQTLDEVETGRKQAREAVLQLDQMLRHHGAAPFAKAKPEREARRPASGPPSLKRPARLRIPTLQGIPVPPQETTTEIEPVPKEEQSPEDEPPAGPGPEEATTWDDSETADPAGEDAPAEPPPEATGPVLREPDPAPEIARNETTEETPPPHPIPAREPNLPQEHGADSDPESRLDEQISAFEEELAMQCPVCRTASVAVRRTAKGRVYYQCVDEECMFISWGRPHHIPCPLCGNPFLVEMEVDEDPRPLKCPRATCRYRDPARRTSSDGTSKGGEAGSRKPRRRVVRRKVRRRKR